MRASRCMHEPSSSLTCQLVGPSGRPVFRLGRSSHPHDARRVPHEVKRRQQGKPLQSLPSRNGAGGSVAEDVPAPVPREDLPREPGLILARGQQGAWDEAGVGRFVVRCYISDEEERWMMWYTGRRSESPDLAHVFPSSGSIGIAVSSDGINWQRGYRRITGERGPARGPDVGEVLWPNPDWWWHDTCHLTLGDVQIFSNASVNAGIGVYWMFYSGGSFEKVDDSLASLPPGVPSPDYLEGIRTRVGLALSQDGSNWARIEGEHHTGALVDVGTPGSWDSLFIVHPQVLAAGPRDMRMYYSSWDAVAGRWRLGLATSQDGFKWEKQGPFFDGSPGTAGAFDSAGASACHVVKDSRLRLYVMFYEGVAGDGSRGIGLAVSKDGLHDWQRFEAPVLEASPAGWDSGSVGLPCSLPMAGGKWRLYYAGREARSAGHWNGIGLAVGDDGAPLFQGVPTSFRRREAKPL
eukprot:jgi/Botrbrau1/20476/Bobra.145_2s0036.1